MTRGPDTAGRYTKFREEATIAVWSPFHRRAWMITPLQFRIMVAAFDGIRTTQRDLAKDLGCSLGGVSEGLRSLVTGGILAKRAGVGRYTRTELNVVPGAYVMDRCAVNVRTIDTDVVRTVERESVPTDNVVLLRDEIEFVLGVPYIDPEVPYIDLDPVVRVVVEPAYLRDDALWAVAA